MGWKWDKKGDHISDFLSGMKPHWDRFLGSLVNWGDLSHSYVNLFVEASRLSPYHAGHIWAILHLVMSGLILGLGVVCLV